jgi:hypothetical protein
MTKDNIETKGSAAFNATISGATIDNRGGGKGRQNERRPR